MSDQGHFLRGLGSLHDLSLVPNIFPVWLYLLAFGFALHT